MSSTLLFTERQNKILSLLYKENRLVQANAYPKEGSELESVFIGKVKNVVPSVDAAFVEYRPKKMGFLPVKNVVNPILTNRKYDGRLIAGDEIVVQVEKDGIKTKSPGLTCNISFTGRYLVLTTGRQNLGFSSKLKEITKKKMKTFLQEERIQDCLKEEQIGMVIRTNAGNLTEPKALIEEFRHLLEQKQILLSQTEYRTCFSCLYKPPAPYITEIRDLYQDSYDKILTDQENIYEEIKQVLGEPVNIDFYQDPKISLNKLYNVETKLQEALAEKVWLKSGAYLIIQPTEALTVIDVNSGKIQKKRNTDEIYYQINREAAQEIALQLRLRNISGIIVVDFINQDDEKLDKELIQYMSQLVKADSVKTNVVDMTPLGLVEITRKKISKSLREQFL